jgi:hypothetical protein
MASVSASTRPSRMLERPIGLTRSLSNMPLSMSATVASPDWRAAKRTESTTMPGRRKER